MIKRLAFPYLLGAASLLAACVPLPTNEQVAPATEAEFNQPVPQGPDLFTDDATVVNVETTTKFAPQLTFNIASLTPGGTPSVTLSIYQTKGELEIRETNSLIERAGFRFDLINNNQEIATGKFELGTPPKMTFDVSAKVITTDKTESALVSVKASNLFASVYVADMRIKQVPGGLFITSIGNATRANDKNGVFTTEVSARLTQTFQAGLIQLPATAGDMRVRTVISTEPDPAADKKSGQKVFRNTFTLN